MAPNGALPSRLAVISMAGQGPAASVAAGRVEDNADVPGLLLAGGDAAAASSTTSDSFEKDGHPGSGGGGDSTVGLEPDLLMSKVSIDTALDRGLSRLPTDTGVVSPSMGMPAMARFGTAPSPHGYPASMPRQTAGLAEMTVREVSDHVHPGPCR